ncbi:MAG: hypothetical protein AAFN77_19620 [Planctomycetota bacterium]
MKTNISKLALSCLAILMVAAMTPGCASTCGTCNSGGIFGGQRVFQNQPVRSTIRSWFQGDNCDACNAPAGQRVFSPNVAPLCDTCNGNAGIQPATPLYGAPIGTSPVGGAQIGTPNLQPGIQPGPDSMLGNGVQPPNM